MEILGFLKIYQIQKTKKIKKTIIYKNLIFIKS